MCPDGFNLSGFTDIMIAVLCIVAGCDYCTNLKNIGIVTARNIVHEAFNTTKGRSCSPLDIVFQLLFQKVKTISENEKAEYKESFLHALCMFLHPVVFDPISDTSKFLNDPYESTDIDENLALYAPYRNLCKNRSRLENVVGSLIGEEGKNIALGWIHPSTKCLRFPFNETPRPVIDWFEKSVGKDVVSKSQQKIAQSGMSNSQTLRQSSSELASVSSNISNLHASQHILTQCSISASPFSNIEKSSSQSSNILSQKSISSESHNNKRKRGNQISSQTSKSSSSFVSSPDLLSPLSHDSRAKFNNRKDENNNSIECSNDDENLSPNECEAHDLPFTQMPSI